MNKRQLNTLMVLFTISLTGFLATQVFWVLGAFRAADESFRQMNSAALRSLVQQGDDMVFHEFKDKLGNRIHTDRSFPPDSLFCKKVLFALIQNEYQHYTLHHDYEYGIVDHLTGKLILSSASGERTNLILGSPYRRNLRGVLPTDRYSVVAWFPDERLLTLQGQDTWLLMLSLLLFIGIIAGYFISVAKLKMQKKITMVQRDFINNITHEFKTPLATISIAAEMIMQHRKNMPEGQLEKYAAIIFDENKRIQHQVDQVMAASLLEEENYRFTMKPLDINILIDRCIETNRLILREIGGTITLQGHCSEPVVADQMHLANVFNNLIENSIKYSADTPEIHVAIRTLPSGVEIDFSDKGIGIPADQQQRIFDRLYRVPVGDLYRTPGTGIGLYYVKRVVESHSGSITVNSTPGAGSCFTVFIPYEPAG